MNFSITGDYITERSRTFWQERQFSKAFKLLDCLIGITREQQEAIITGKAKVEGVNELDFVPDDWTPPEGYLTHFSRVEIP
jgi:hypothetical protein